MQCFHHNHYRIFVPLWEFSFAHGLFIQKKQEKPQPTTPALTPFSSFSTNHHHACLFPLPSGYHVEMMGGIAYSKKSGIHSQGSNFKVDS